LPDLPGLSFFNELTPNVIAALVGAGATLIAALINLRVAWRREVLDRLNRRSSTKGRRGLLIAILIMVVAAGVGGYASALYLMQNDQQSTRAMRLELRQRIGEIKEATTRLEQTRVGDRASLESEARLYEERRRGGEGVAATTRIGPCRARFTTSGGIDAAEGAPCKEGDVAAVGVCVSVPATASVYEVTPYARTDNDSTAWAERRAALGASVGNVRFGAQPIERPDAPAQKNVCVDVWSLDSQHAIDARLVVRYLLPDRSEATGASPQPLRAASTNQP
jgi:hypothetical protein